MASSSLNSQPYENMLLRSPVARNTNDWWTQLLPLWIFRPLTEAILPWAAPSQRQNSMQKCQGRPILAKCATPPLGDLDLRSPHWPGQTFVWTVLQFKTISSFPPSVLPQGSHTHQNLKALPRFCRSHPNKPLKHLMPFCHLLPGRPKLLQPSLSEFSLLPLWWGFSHFAWGLCNDLCGNRLAGGRGSQLSLFFTPNIPHCLECHPCARGSLS